MKALLIGLACIGAYVEQVQMASVNDVDCTKYEQVLEESGPAQAWSFMSDKYKIPTNADEFSKSCEVAFDALKIMKKYNKECAANLTKQFMGAILNTRTKYLDSCCVRDSPDNKANIATSKCAHDHSEPFKKLEEKYIRKLNGIYDANLADSKDRIRHTCCATEQIKKDFLAAAKENCPDHEKTIESYIDSYISEALSLVCPSKEKLDCDNLESLKIDQSAPLKSAFYLKPVKLILNTLDT